MPSPPEHKRAPKAWRLWRAVCAAEGWKCDPLAFEALLESEHAAWWAGMAEAGATAAVLRDAHKRARIRAALRDVARSAERAAGEFSLDGAHT